MTESLPALAALLPPKTELGNLQTPSEANSNASGHSENLSSFWTLEEIAGARIASIRRALLRGWAYTGGLLIKGKIKALPGTLMTSKVGDVDYNPRADAPALRVYPGCIFVNANRYEVQGVGFVDKNGQFLDPDACSECGSLHGEHRFRVRVWSSNPFAQRWEQAWTYCRRCVNAVELADNERRLQATPNRRR